MKSLMVTAGIIFWTVLASAAQTSCPSISGTYVDSQNFKYVVKVAPDCKSVQWTVQYETAPVTPDPRIPKTSVLYFDGTERQSAIENSRNSFVTKGSIDGKKFVLDEKTEDGTGDVIRWTRTTYSMQYTSLSQLVEENFLVNSDGSTTLWYTRLYTKVH